MNPLGFRTDEQKVLYIVAYYKGEARTQWDAFKKKRGDQTPRILAANPQNASKEARV
jgi:hypothetical protein